MFEPDSEQAIYRATKLAKDYQHEYICVEHLLASLLEAREIIDLLDELGVDATILLGSLDNFFSEKLEVLPENEAGNPNQSLGFQRVLQRAILHSQYSSSGSISNGDLLAAIFTETDSHAVFFLKSHGINRLDILEGISHEEVYDDSELDEDELEAQDPNAKKNPLNEYTYDLNAKAKKGLIDPLIGREKENERAIHVLCRRTKNNPLFVGDQGVGKTALAEGLALRVVQEKVPTKLRNLPNLLIRFRCTNCWHPLPGRL